jgi:hypothetical protein
VITGSLNRGARIAHFLFAPSHRIVQGAQFSVFELQVADKLLVLGNAMLISLRWPGIPLFHPAVAARAVTVEGRGGATIRRSHCIPSG